MSLPKRLRGLLMATLLLLPAPALARDVATCAALYTQLNNTRQVIGNTAEIRRYAQELAQVNIQIRGLRVEMRRSACGGGSIVTLGGNGAAGVCEQMRKELQSMEDHRDAVVAERNKATLVQQPSERETILASIRANSCIPSDVEEQEKERLKVQGLELPKQDGYSGITNLRTTPPAVQTKASTIQHQQPGPERPYDPSKKVRMVGPVFLPEEGIDLAHPKSAGPQPQQ